VDECKPLLPGCTADKMREAAERYLIGKEAAVAIVGSPGAAAAVRAQGYKVLDAEGKPLEA
jgi:hypothetical protein